jgi:hypothetical protein
VGDLPHEKGVRLFERLERRGEKWREFKKIIDANGFIISMKGDFAFKGYVRDNELLLFNDPVLDDEPYSWTYQVGSPNSNTITGRGTAELELLIRAF